nr:glycosyl hydrolase [Paenibacillus hamazuiensis]
MMLVPAAVAAAVFILAAYAAVKPDEPAGPAAPEPKSLPSTVVWWDEMIEKAKQTNRLDVAADYTYRRAAYAKSVGQEAEAAALYERSSELWKQSGAAGAPPGGESSAVQGESVFEIYMEAPAAADARPPAKFEPGRGVYLGMLGADRRVGFDFSKIESVYGRKHAMFLSYVGWRKYQADTDSYFPFRQAGMAKKAGGALQIGWEPRYGLDDVKDDEYVRRFAREAKSSGIPVFLRYASEMNGAWVPWHDDPQTYIEKFRLIHDIMKEEAPNVAMVWSPNFLPADNIDAYYPGDGYVDWIGFSLYATPYALEKLDLSTNQIDYFRPLYEKYSHKPIMISEGAVSHYHLKSGTDFAKWGEGQLGYMYGYLPKLFPQLKAITYFNYSKSRAVQTGMEHVYDLGENPLMDNLYQRLIRQADFLSDIGSVSPAPESAFSRISAIPFEAGGRLKLLPYIKLPEGRQPVVVAVSQNGANIAFSYEIPWQFDIDIRTLDPSHPVVFTAYNGKMQPLAQVSVPWDFRKK